MKKNDNKKMLEMYEQWQSSGLTMNEFSQRQGIARTTMYYWAGKFRNHTKKTDKPGNKKTSFQQVELKTSTSLQARQAAVVITYPNGVVVELHQPGDAGFVRQLIFS